jgi:toxin CptA
MAAHRTQPPLTIEPRTSHRLAAFVALTHLLAAAAVLGLPMPWPLLLPAVGLSLGYQFWVRVLARAPWSIRALTWNSDGTWTIALRSGAETQARLAPSTFVSVTLVVLNLYQGHWRRWSVPLFGDALDPEQLRRLRQRLRIDGIGPEPLTTGADSELPARPHRPIRPRE